MGKPAQRIILFLYILSVLICSISTVAQADAVSIFPISSLENVANFTLSPRGNRIAVVNTNGTAFLWNWKDNHQLVDLEGSSFYDVGSLVWSPDEHYIAAGYPNGAKIWNTETGELLHSFSGHPVSLIDEMFRDQNYLNFADWSGIAFSPDSTILATANPIDSTVILRRVADGVITGLLQLSDSTMGVWSITFSSDEVLVIVSLEQIEFWNFRSHDRLQRINFPDLSPYNFIILGISPIVVSPDGSKVAVGNGRIFSEIKIYDVNSGNLIDSFQAPLAATSLEWTSDSQNIVVSFTDWPLISEGFDYVASSIRSWNIESSLLTNTYRLTTERNLNIELEPNEILIGIGSIDRKEPVLIWNQQTGEVYNAETLAPFTQTYEVSMDGASNLSLNSSTSLLGAGIGNTVVIWDFSSGEEVTRIEMNQLVRRVDFIDEDQIVFLTTDNVLWFASINTQ
ncbi:MAG: hypothetical protein ABI700_16565 [Chloroflexota bacterium]